MKILLVSEKLAPLIGGLQRHVYLLAQYLSANGHEVTILTSAHCSASRVEGLAEDIRILPTLRIGQKYIPALSTLADSWNISSNVHRYCSQFDIVHFHTTNMFFHDSRTAAVQTLHFDPCCILSAEIDSPCRLPSWSRCTVCHVNHNAANASIAPVTALYCGIYYKLTQSSLTNCSKVICVSDYTRRAVEEVFRLANVTRIQNFVDIEGEIEPAIRPDFSLQNHLNIPEDTATITFFGRLVQGKGLDVLIRAVNLVLKDSDRKVYVIIGGEGPQKQALERMAKTVGNIVFIGVPSRTTQLNLMAQSDIFVYPSTATEACPTSILEAMSLGLPVIATGIGGIPELIDNGKGGYLIAPDSPVAMAETIGAMLRDEELRLKAGRYNQEKAKDFDIGKVGPRIVQVYHEVAQTRSK